MAKCYRCGTTENLTDYEYWGRVEWYCDRCYDEMKDESLKEVEEMGERKIHVLPDENLGGVLREFVEVDRKANVGDYVYFNDGIDTPKYLKVTGYNHIIDFYKVEHDPNEWEVTIEVSYEACRTLEPTDIICINGARYRLVDRKAKVGEKVLVVEDFAYGKVGEIHTIKEVYRDVYTTDKASIMIFGRCLVLEPVEPAEEGDDVLTVDETEASKSVLDMLASLAQKIVELERKIDRLGERTESNARDIETWAQEVERLKAKTNPDTITVTLTLDKETIAEALEKAVIDE